MSSDIEPTARQYPSYEKRPHYARDFTEEQWERYVAAHKKRDPHADAQLADIEASGRILSEDLNTKVGP